MPREKGRMGGNISRAEKHAQPYFLRSPPQVSCFPCQKSFIPPVWHFLAYCHILLYVNLWYCLPLWGKCLWHPLTGAGRASVSQRYFLWLTYIIYHSTEFKQPPSLVKWAVRMIWKSFCSCNDTFIILYCFLNLSSKGSVCMAVWLHNLLFQ